MPTKPRALFAACIALAALFAASLLAPQQARACFGFTVCCEDQIFSEYDGGLQDVEYFNISILPAGINAEASHVYSIKYSYYPGCGNTYSEKLHIQRADMPAGWTCSLKDASNSDINGAAGSWAGTGEYYAYLTVTSPGGAAVGERADVTVRAWMNDTYACNEHNTLDVETHTYIGTPAERGPLAIHLDQPNGGEGYWVGLQREILWRTEGGIPPITVKAEWSRTGPGGPWCTVGDDLENDGQFSWIIPEPVSSNNYMRLTATDSSPTPQVCVDVGDGAFTTQSYGNRPSVPMITITTPNGGTIAGGCPLQVAWSVSGKNTPMTVRLEYSTSGPSGPYALIADSVPASGTYSWSVPAIDNANCCLRATITDSLSNTHTDTTDNPIAISTSEPPPVPELPLAGAGAVCAAAAAIIPAAIFFMIFGRKTRK